MSTADPPTPDVTAGAPTPALLGASRGAYLGGVRRALVAAGFSDLSPVASQIVAGMGNGGVPLQELARQVGGGADGVRALDSLVANGYLAKDDSGRLGLTDKGRAAAAAVRQGIGSVEDSLRARLGAEGYTALRRGLAVLCDLRDESERGAASSTGA